MDRNANGSGTALYIREYIPSRQISIKIDDKNMEHFFVEINLRKRMINFMSLQPTFAAQR